MSPTNERFNTGLFKGFQSGATHFGLPDVKNKVVCNENFKKKLKKLLDTEDYDNLALQMSKQLFEKLDMNLKKMIEKHSSDVQEHLDSKLGLVKKRLQKGHHRIMPVSTSNLEPMIRMGIENAQDFLINDLEKGLKSFKLKLTDTETAKAMFKQDLLNNDVPSFYYCPAEGQVYYHGHVIGKSQ